MNYVLCLIYKIKMINMYSISIFIGILTIVHSICIKNNMSELSCWYLLHFIGNFYITILCIKPISKVLEDPILELFNPTPYYDTMIIIFILHSYHLLFFKCTKDDIFHHLLFVGVGTFTIFIFNNGYYSAVTHFFVCGLPGGIDYFYQFLYKSELILKSTRLRASVFLNVWIRSPGLICMANMAIINFIYSEKKLFDIIQVILQVILTLGNGQMYMRDIVYTAGKNYIFD